MKGHVVEWPLRFADCDGLWMIREGGGRRQQKPWEVKEECLHREAPCFQKLRVIGLDCETEVHKTKHL